MRVPRHVRCVDTGWRLSRLHYAWVVAGVTFLVPPTVRLASDLFGRNSAGVIFGWIAAAHQLGAALAALGAGAIRTAFGDYRLRSGSPAPSASSPVSPFFLVASYSINMLLPLQRHPVRRARPSTPLRRLSRRDVPQRKAAGTAARSYRRNVLGRRWRHAARRPARTRRARLLEAQAEMAEARCLSSIP
jgi:hypothetical protein